MAARDAEEFRRLEALTQGFRLYSYWNELPYVRLSALEGLLKMWQARVGGSGQAAAAAGPS